MFSSTCTYPSRPVNPHFGYNHKLSKSRQGKKNEGIDLRKLCAAVQDLTWKRNADRVVNEEEK